MDFYGLTLKINCFCRGKGEGLMRGVSEKNSQTQEAREMERAAQDNTVRADTTFVRWYNTEYRSSLYTTCRYSTWFHFCTMFNPLTDKIVKM